MTHKQIVEEVNKAIETLEGDGSTNLALDHLYDIRAHLPNLIDKAELIEMLEKEANFYTKDDAEYDRGVGTGLQAGRLPLVKVNTPAQKESA